MPRRPVFPKGAVLLIVISCLVPELIWALNGLSADGTGSWRETAVQLGGFWPGLLSGAPSAFFGQPVAMFLTYGFLHAGIVHLGMNMIALHSLGRLVVARVGSFGFVKVYFISMVAGGLGYGLLASSGAPMVGASGAIYGLLGALLKLVWIEKRRAGLSVWPAIRALAIILALNLALWGFLAGNLAWQAHLGGFIAGLATQLRKSSI